MRYSTTSGMILAAMTIGEAVAGPTHAHKHRHLQKKDYDVDWNSLDWNDMGIDWSSAWAAGQHTSTSAAPVVVPTPTAAAPVVAPAATTTAAAAPPPAAHTSAASGVVGAVLNEVESLFDGLVGISNGLKSFGGSTTPSGVAGDNYMGNVGAPYGANIILDPPSGTPFTNTFHNSQSKSITVNVWQKVGPDMRPLSGSALAPTWTTLTFVLAAGASRTVGFLDNTQVAWAEACSEKTGSGAFQTAWGELNVDSAGSGYDVSAINDNSNYNMVITSSEASSCTSSPAQGLNYWKTATEPVGGSDGSCFIAQSTATLHTVMGGAGY
ncbi:hypothetical protein N431DRAFT_547412 [Stipitochalara longipes BDJ]|nr:hypothetical protein N431DRAFT_547412 [Stipitochalara longipes BDJ]